MALGIIMKLVRAYSAHLSPGWLIPPHGVVRPERFRSLVSSMDRYGWKGRQIIAIHDRSFGDLYRALTGSHRIAAAGATDTDVPCRILHFDRIDRESLIEVLTWRNGYFEIKDWLNQWDKQTARIFSYDLRW